MHRMEENGDEADTILIQRIAIVHQYFLQDLVIAQEIAEVFLAEIAEMVAAVAAVETNIEMRLKRRIFYCFEI